MQLGRRHGLLERLLFLSCCSTQAGSSASRHGSISCSRCSRHCRRETRASEFVKNARRSAWALLCSITTPGSSNRSLAVTGAKRSLVHRCPTLIELLGRFINWRVLAALAVMLAVYELARRKLRMSTFVFVGILITAMAPESGDAARAEDKRESSRAATAVAATYPAPDTRSMSPEQLDELLSAFYEARAFTAGRLPPGPEDSRSLTTSFWCTCAPCRGTTSRQCALTGNALFDRFDILFTAFDSAASYSGPAAIRLLRGNCGATTHQELYSPARPECLVIDGLQERWVRASLVDEP